MFRITALAALTAFSLLLQSHVSSALTQGDIVLVSYGSQAGQDRFTLVTTVDLPAGTKFTLTDSGWLTSLDGCSATSPFTNYRLLADSSHFTRAVAPGTNEAIGDGYIVYTSPGLHAGDLISYIQGQSHPNWDTSNIGNFFQSGGDQIILYSGTAPTPCFIWAWTNTRHGWRYNFVKDGRTRIEGSAVDMETDSDYPLNANLQWPCDLSSVVDNQRLDRTYIASDNGASTCGKTGQSVDWPELGPGSMFTYYGPTTVTPQMLRVLASNRIFFTNADVTLPPQFTLVEPATTNNARLLSLATPSRASRELAQAAGTTLGPGDVILTEIQAGGVLKFAFLAEVTAGTEFYVTDRGYSNALGDFVVVTTSSDDTEAVTGEGTIKFVASRDYSGGEIVAYPGSSDFSAVEGDLSFAQGGDSIIVFQPNSLGDANAAPTFDFIWLVTSELDGSFSGPNTVTGTDVPGQLMSTVDPSYHCSNLPAYQALGATDSPSFYYTGTASGIKEAIVCDVLNPANFGRYAPSTPLDAIIFETTLTVNSIRILHVNSAGHDDRFVFILLTPIAPGTKIYFTDHGYLSSGALTDFSTDSWAIFTAAKRLEAGTTIKSFVSSSSGTWDVSSLDLSADGDQIFALQVVNGLNRFRTGVIWRRMWGTGNQDASFSDLPAAIAGVALQIELAAFQYSGPTTGTIPELSGAMANHIYVRSAPDLPVPAFHVSIVTSSGIQLNEGDIAVVQWDKDTDVRLSLLAVVDIPAGVTFYVTDIGYNRNKDRFNLYTTYSAGFNAEEGVVMYVVEHAIPAGTVIVNDVLWEDTQTAPWYNVRGEISLADLDSHDNTRGDQLLIFQNSPSGTNNFIWATDFSSTGVSPLPGSIVSGDAAENGFVSDTFDSDDKITRSGIPIGITTELSGYLASSQLSTIVQLPCAQGTIFEYYRYTGPTSGTKRVLIESLTADVIDVGGATAALVIAAQRQFTTYEFADSTVAPFDPPPSFDIQTTLWIGDAAFLNVGPDSFSLILLRDVVVNTQIHVSDSAWDASFPNSETHLSYLFTEPTHAGAILTYSPASPNGWVVETASTEPVLSLTFTSGDSLSAFQPSTNNGYSLIALIRFGPGVPDAITPLPLGVTEDSPSVVSVISDGDTYAAYSGPTSAAAGTLAVAIGSPRFWLRSTLALVTPMVFVVPHNPIQPTELTVGSLAFIRVSQQMDEPLEFDIVVLEALSAGTTFHVTSAVEFDSEGQGRYIGTNEYTSPAGGTPAGTVLQFPSNPNFTPTEAGITFQSVNGCPSRGLIIFQTLLSNSLTIVGDDPPEFRLVGSFSDCIGDFALQEPFGDSLINPSRDYVYTGPRTGDRDGLFMALQEFYFWNYGQSIPAISTAFVLESSDHYATSYQHPNTSPLLFPADIVVTCQFSDAANLEFSVVLTVMTDMEVGTVFYVTDLRITRDVNDDFAEFETSGLPGGVVKFVANTGVAAGTALTIFTSRPSDWSITHPQFFYERMMDQYLTIFQYDMAATTPERIIWGFGDDSGNPPNEFNTRATLLPASTLESASYRGPTQGTRSHLLTLISDPVWWFLSEDTAASCNSELTLLSFNPAADTLLVPGNLIISRFRKSPFEMDVVLLTSVSSGTVIFFQIGDYLISWTAPTAVTAGTILTFQADTPANGWQTISGDVPATPEQVFAFQYSEAMRSYLWFLGIGPMLPVDFPVALEDQQGGLQYGVLVPQCTNGEIIYLGPTAADVSIILAAANLPEFMVDLTPLTLPAMRNPSRFLQSNTPLFAGDVLVTRVQQTALEFMVFYDLEEGTNIFIELSTDTTQILYARFIVPVGGLTTGSVVTIDPLADAPDFNYQVISSTSASINFDSDGLLISFSVFTEVAQFDAMNRAGARFGEWASSTSFVTLVEGFSALSLALSATTDLSTIGQTYFYNGPRIGTTESIRAAVASRHFWLTTTNPTPTVPTADFNVTSSPSAPVINIGSLAVIRMESGGGATDFVLVALDPIPVGTVFYITDVGSDGTGLSSANDPALNQFADDRDGMIECTTTTELQLGDTFEPVGNADCRVVSRDVNLHDDSATGDQLCIFQWALETRPSYKWCFDNTGTWEEADAAAVHTSAVSAMPVVLSESSSTLLSSLDYWMYNGPTQGDRDSLGAAIGSGDDTASGGFSRRMWFLFWAGSDNINSIPSSIPSISVGASTTSTILEPGCVAVVAFDETVGPVGAFDLLVLEDLVPGSELYVTDHGFAAAAFGLVTMSDDDGTIRYTVSDNTLPAGSIIHYEDMAAGWDVVQPGFRLVAGDSLIVFQYYDVTAPHYLWAHTNNAMFDVAVTDLNSETMSENPFGTDVSFATAVSEIYYSSTRSGTKRELITLLTDPASWSGVAPMSMGFTIQTDLTACDIAIVSVSSSSFQFIPLVPLSEGTTIGWTTDSLPDMNDVDARSGVYVAPEDIAAGTVITVVSMDPWLKQDTLLLFQSSILSADPWYLWGFSSLPWNGFSALQDSTSTLPPALDLGNCYTVFDGHRPVRYDNATTGEAADLSAWIHNADFWAESAIPFTAGFAFRVLVMTLEPGCVAVVNFHSDETLDHLQLLVLENIAEGSTFFITDRGWTSNGFLTYDEDCTLQYTAPGTVHGGSVLTWEEPANEDIRARNAANGWQMLDCPAGFKLTNLGESLLIYHGPDKESPSTFLWGFNNNDNGWNAASDPVPTASDPTNREMYSQLPTSIIEFNIDLSHYNNYMYMGPSCGDKQTLIAGLTNPIFWFGNDDDVLVQDIVSTSFSATGNFTFGSCPHDPLGPGSIVVVRKTDASDFTLLLLDDVQAGSVIWVTDAGYRSSGNSFPALMEPETGRTDGLLRYTFPADRPAGSLVEFDFSAPSAGWSPVLEAFDVSGPDQIFVFVVKTPSFPDFVWGFDNTREGYTEGAVSTINGGWDTAIIDVFVDSELPAALTGFSTALSAEFNNWVFTGLSEATKPSFIAAVAEVGGYFSAARRRLIGSFWFGAASSGALVALGDPFEVFPTTAGSTVLAAGSVVPIFVDTSVNPTTEFALVFISEAPAGTVLYVTDKTYLTDGNPNNNEFLQPDHNTDDAYDNEGTLKLTLTAPVAKGAIIEFPGPVSAAYEWEEIDEGFELQLENAANNRMAGQPFPEPDEELIIFQWQDDSVAPHYLWHLYICTGGDCGTAPPSPAELSPASSCLAYITPLTINDVANSFGYDSSTNPMSGIPEVLLTALSDDSLWTAGFGPATEFFVETKLNPGDVAIVSLDLTPATFRLQFVIRVDVCKGTSFEVVDFRRFDWDLDAATADLLRYTAHSDLDAGTVVTYTGLDNEMVKGYWEVEDNAAGPESFTPSMATDNPAYVIRQLRECPVTANTGFDPLFVFVQDTTNAAVMPASQIPPITNGHPVVSTATNPQLLWKYTSNLFLLGGDFTTAVENVVLNWDVAPTTVNTEFCALGCPLDTDIVIAKVVDACLGEPTVLSIVVTNSEAFSTLNIDFGDGSPLETVTLATDQRVVSQPGGLTLVTVLHRYAMEGVAYDVVVAGSGITAMSTVTIAPKPRTSIVAEFIGDVDETDTSLLKAVISDTMLTAPFLVTIDWGDGTAPEVVWSSDLGHVWATHTYVDDGPGPTDTYTVLVSAGNHVETLTHVVNNLVPVVDLSDTVPIVPVLGKLFLRGTLSDPNPADSFALLTIVWGDGTMTNILDMDPDHEDLVSWDPDTGAFVVCHTFVDDRLDYSLQAFTVDDDGGFSAIVSLDIEAVPQHAVQGGLVIRMLGDCDQISLSTFPLPHLNELRARVAALIAEETNEFIIADQILLISIMCKNTQTSRRLAALDGDAAIVVVTFKVLGLTDIQAKLVAFSLIDEITGVSSGPLVPFNATSTFGEPMVMTCDCDPECVACVRASSPDHCSLCPPGMMVQPGHYVRYGPCVPMPSTSPTSSPSSSPSASASASTSGSESTSGSATYSATTSNTGSASATASATASPSDSVSVSASASASASISLSASASASVSASASISASASNAASISQSASASASASASVSSNAGSGWTKGQGVGLSEPSPAVGGAGVDTSGDNGAGGVSSGENAEGSSPGSSSAASSLSMTTIIGLVVGVVCGVVVAAVVAVLYTRGKAASAPVVSPVAASAPSRRSRNRTRLPPAPASTLWKVMHTPPRRKSSAAPDSRA